LFAALQNLLTSLFSNFIWAHAIRLLGGRASIDQEQEMLMRSIRKFAYVAVLSLSIFSTQPTLAVAEDARGVFTLSHEVHWQNYVLRPGDYEFSLGASGLPTLLTLRGLHGTGTSAMLLVPDIESPKTLESSKLVLVSRDGRSFVSTMQLREYDMTLRFAVPPESPLK
jgi:hypothetical protein